MTIKDLTKKILSNGIIQIIIANILYYYLLFVFKTSKLIIVGNYDEFQKQILSKKSFIFITWHGRTAIIGTFFKNYLEKKIKFKKKICVLSSKHRDGKLAAKFVKKIKYNQIFGSTINKKREDSLKKSGAVSSIITILREIKSGSAIFLAPDGPRGPLHKMNSEIVNIAKKHDVPIFPLAISYSFKYQLKSWDQFQIPFPFGKIYIDFLDQLFTNKNTDFEESNKILEERLDKISKNDEILKKL